MSVDLGDTNIDPADPKYGPMLANLQGNILKAHGRKESDHLFLRFSGDRSAVKAWIRGFARDEITSAKEQLDDARGFRATGTKGPTFASFGLSALGYEAIGIDTGAFGPTGQSFRNGMKHHAFAILSRNRDPLPAEWEPPFQGRVDAVIILADDSANVLAAKTQQVSASLNRVASILGVERGTVLRNAKGEPIEHFGYVDARSQPLFLKSDIDAEKAKGTDVWDPSAPLRTVLVPDPHATVDDSLGSYLVFRKLRQDVAGFNARIRELASQLTTNEPLAGALVVGRFKDGTPVTLQPNDGLGAANNFVYRPLDPAGNRCPFHAHIRKANQRGTNPLLTLEQERMRRIARRGIPYGIRPPGAGEVGLLFQCFQGDIALQFEFIQRTWVDNPNFPELLLFPGLNTGDDALIGQHPRAPQKWPRRWGQGGRFLGRRSFNFGGFVRLRGGEYFFAPSVGFLQGL